MIDGLKPYAEMKDSGIEWLGAVPAHWDVRRLKYLLRERDTRSEKGEEQLLRVSQYTGITERKRDDGAEGPDTRAASLVGYKVVDRSDLAVNIMLAWNGSLGVSPHDGIVSPAYGVYRFNPGIEPMFFHHLLRSPTYKARIKTASRGVVESRLRLYTDDLYRIEALLPPIDEQAAIVRFLDHADRRIRRAIAAKQKLIRLLEEQKRAIIHRAVTRGLDPDVRLKPSGVEWLGDVPEHWEIRKLRSLFRRQGSGTTPAGDRYYDGSIPWVMSGDLNDAIVTTTKRSVTAEALEDVGALKVYSPRSLVVAMYGATIGKTGVLALAACTNQACCVFSEHFPSVSVEFLQLAVNVARPALLIQSFGGGQPNINANVVKALRVPVPPLQEQMRILEWTRQNAFGPAIEVAKEEISLLKEYRARLIADVVTGKIDVRDVATKLHELIEPEENELDVDDENEEESIEDVATEYQAA